MIYISEKNLVILEKNEKIELTTTEKYTLDFIRRGESITIEARENINEPVKKKAKRKVK